MTSNRRPEVHADLSELVAIKNLRPYGVCRTKAFEKINPDKEGFDPTFPEPLIIGGRYFFVRAEMLQWALKHRRPHGRTPQ